MLVCLLSMGISEALVIILVVSPRTKLATYSRLSCAILNSLMVVVGMTRSMQTVDLDMANGRRISDSGIYVHYIWQL